MTFEENGIVTTSYRCTQSDEEIALLASERTGMQYVRRGSMSAHFCAPMGPNDSGAGSGLRGIFTPGGKLENP